MVRCFFPGRREKLSVEFFVYAFFIDLLFLPQYDDAFGEIPQFWLFLKPSG